MAVGDSFCDDARLRGSRFVLMKEAKGDLVQEHGGARAISDFNTVGPVIQQVNT